MKTSLSVFRRKHRLFVCPHATDEIGTTVFGNRVISLSDTDPIDQILGAIDAGVEIARANAEVRFPWSRDKTDFARPLFEAAGAKTWTAFHRGATGLGIVVHGDRIDVQTDDRMYQTDRAGLRAAIAEFCGVVDTHEAARGQLADGSWIAAAGVDLDALIRAVESFDPTMSIEPSSAHTNDSWTVGKIMPPDIPPQFVVALSKSLATTVCVFGSSHIVEWFSWSMATNGTPVRAFAYLGERGEIIENWGEPTPVELDLGLAPLRTLPPDSPLDDEVLDLVSPETVRTIAAGWGIDLES